MSTSNDIPIKRSGEVVGWIKKAQSEALRAAWRRGPTPVRSLKKRATQPSIDYYRRGVALLAAHGGAVITGDEPNDVVTVTDLGAFDLLAPSQRRAMRRFEGRADREIWCNCQSVGTTQQTYHGLRKRGMVTVSRGRARLTALGHRVLMAVQTASLP